MPTQTADNWMTPGRTLQRCIAQVIADEPSRDSRGRFARKHTPQEVILKTLRTQYGRMPNEARWIAKQGSAPQSARPADGDAYPAGGESPSPISAIPRITRTRAWALLVCAGFLGFCALYPEPIVKVFSGLYSAAAAVVAWEGK